MKLMKTTFVLWLSLFLLTACLRTEQAQAAEGDKIPVAFAGTEGAASGQSRMMVEAAKILNDSGRFDAQVFLSGALPGDTDNLVTQAQLGVYLVVPSDPGRLASQFRIPDLNILMAPYVLTDYKILEKLPQTILYQEWQKQLSAQGIAIVGNMFNGFRNFYTVDPVKKVEDLAGLRIRGFGNSIGLALGKYLGFAQTTVNATEIYAGIQAKSLDGCELQAATGDSYRLYEVAKNLAITKHYMLQSTYVCSQRLLDDMPEADREFFVKTITDTANKYSEIVAGEEAGFYENFTKNGGTVAEVNIPDFEAAIAPLYVNNDLGLTPGLKDEFFKQLGL